MTQDGHASARERIGTNFVAMYKALGGGWDASEHEKDLVPAEMIETMQQRVNWGDMLKSSATQE